VRGILHLCFFAFFLLRLDIIPNDDTYVYFNYARTALEGLPFCYDDRAIPSEGFTSILYLLLLLPFEALGINLMFASVLINLLALLGILFLFERIIQFSEWLSKSQAAWAASLAWGLLLLDPNLAEVTGRGLETILGIFAYLLAVYCGIRAVKQLEMGNRYFSFLGSCLLSFFIRPGTEPPRALAVLLLFLISPQKGRRMLQSLFFLALFGIYLFWKQVYFGDIFPTAFYRKVQAGHLDGYLYIRSWVLAYWPGLLLLGLGMGAWAAKHFYQKKSLRFLFVPAAIFLLISALYFLVFHRYVLPMVGYGFRHIYLVTVLLYVGLGVISVQLIREIQAYKKIILRLSAGIILLISLILAWPLQLSKWHLYAQAEQAVDEFYYVKLGRFLRQQLDHHQEITLIYGDAGALPYELRCKFLDTNGLSEPAIARFFQRKDSRQKAEDFADYLLSWSPDLLIIAGDTAADGRVPHAITQHDPFRALRNWGNYHSEKLWAYERLKQAGFIYHHSATGYFYDLHFLVDAQSDFFQEIKHALSAHQSSFSSYQLKQGLRFYNEKRQVSFDACE